MSNIVKIRNSINNYFEAQREEHEKVKANNNRRRWGKYYGTKQWKALRQQYYLDHPICEVCERQGIITPTEEIHHLHVWGQAATEEAKWRLLLNYNNLCACCSKHHDMFHKYMREHNLDSATIEDILKYEEETSNYI